MALSFISNIWNSFPPPLQNRNPEIVAFQQRKRPRFNNLSFSNSSTNSSPTSFNPNPLLVQNNNSFLPHHNKIFHTPPTNDNISFFNSLSSPPTIFPLEELDHHSGQYFNGCSSDPEFFSDFLTDEDRVLLAPLLTEPQICGFSSSVPVPRDDINVYDDPHDQENNNITSSDHQLKKPSSSTVSPQSIAARERRRKITEKTQELGKLIPGGNKMSTAEMFQSAYKYVKFLQAQVSVLQSVSSSIQEMKQEPLHIKELQVLASPAVQQKLYSEEKCLVPKQFVDQTLENHLELPSNSF